MVYQQARIGALVKFCRSAVDNVPERFSPVVIYGEDNEAFKGTSI